MLLPPWSPGAQTVPHSRKGAAKARVYITSQAGFLLRYAALSVLSMWLCGYELRPLTIFFFSGGIHFHVHPIITGLDPTKPWWESTSIYFLCCEKVLRCFWPCVSSVWSPFCSLKADSKRSNSTSQGHKSGALAIMCAFEKKLSRAGSHRSQPWFPSPCFVG